MRTLQRRLPKLDMCPGFDSNTFSVIWSGLCGKVIKSSYFYDRLTTDRRVLILHSMFDLRGVCDVSNIVRTLPYQDRYIRVLTIKGESSTKRSDHYCSRLKVMVNRATGKVIAWNLYCSGMEEVFHWYGREDSQPILDLLSEVFTREMEFMQQYENTRTEKITHWF